MQRIFAVLAFVSWCVLLWPFPSSVFLASCLACVSLPLFRNLCSRMDRRYATTILAMILAVGVILPITVVVIMVTPQAVNGLKMLDNLQKSGWFAGPEAQAILDYADEWVSKIPGMEGGVRTWAMDAVKLAGTAVRTVLAGSVGLAGSTLQMGLNIFIMLLLAMVGVLYASTFFHFAAIATRFSTPVLERFIKAIRASIRAVLAGVVLVAIIQGVLCGIGFAYAGVPQAGFWGMLATLVAPIPLVGTALVWLPACVYLWFGVSKGAALGLALWCCLAVAGADNFLRPFFLRGGIEAPFSVVIVSVICGMVTFGAVGIVAGPVLAAFAIQAAREAEQYKPHADSYIG